jgi:hypothetical protein
MKEVNRQPAFRSDVAKLTTGSCRGGRVPSRILKPRKSFLEEREAFAAAILKPILIEDAYLVVAILDKPSLFEHSKRKERGVRLGVEQGCRQ